MGSSPPALILMIRIKDTEQFRWHLSQKRNVNGEQVGERERVYVCLKRAGIHSIHASQYFALEKFHSDGNYTVCRKEHQYAFTWNNSNEIIHCECTFDCHIWMALIDVLLIYTALHFLLYCKCSVYLDCCWQWFFAIKMFYDCRWKFLLFEQKLVCWGEHRPLGASKRWKRMTENIWNLQQDTTKEMSDVCEAFLGFECLKKPCNHFCIRRPIWVIKHMKQLMISQSVLWRWMNPARTRTFGTSKSECWLIK